MVLSYLKEERSIFKQGPSQLAVIATEDETSVKITLAGNNTDIDADDPDVTKEGNVVYLELNKYQSFQVCLIYRVLLRNLINAEEGLL